MSGRAKPPQVLLGGDWPRRRTIRVLNTHSDDQPFREILKLLVGGEFFHRN